MERTELISEVKQLVEKYVLDENIYCGMFFTRNIVGDIMSTVFDKEGVTVDICFNWAYFEIFGLTKDEEKEIMGCYNQAEAKAMEQMRHRD